MACEVCKKLFKKAVNYEHDICNKYRIFRAIYDLGRKN